MKAEYGKVKIMFLWPYGPNDLVGKVIQDAEGDNEPTHVAVMLDNSFLEAEWYGIVRTPLSKYATRKHEVWEMEVPYPHHSKMAVQILLGKHYSLLSCFWGLLRIKLGVKLPFNDSDHANCSQVGTQYLAMLGRELFGSDSPAGITPSELRKAMKQKGGRLVVQWPLKASQA